MSSDSTVCVYNMTFHVCDSASTDTDWLDAVPVEDDFALCATRGSYRVFTQLRVGM